MIIRVLPDEPAIDREFDYEVPPDWVDHVRIGAVVRVDLKGRRVRGWVTAIDVEATEGVAVRSISKVSGIGPPQPILELATWASRRWAGPRPRFLRTATSDRIVARLPRLSAQRSTGAEVPDRLAAEAFGRGGAVVRLAPNADEWPLVLAAASRRALILTPSVAHARMLWIRLGRAGVDAALYPRDWADSAAGKVTVGARAAAWAPVTDLERVLVLDEHDEGFQEESAPTWNARDVAVERAARDGAAWVVASPSPSLESLTSGVPVLTQGRQVERSGWPIVEVVDRRGDDPATGEWCSPALARVLQAGGRVLCVLNRKGRARLAYCHSCGELARDPVEQRPYVLDGERFTAPWSGEERPVVCEACGSTRFRRVKLGVKGVAEELERIARRPVVDITGDSEATPDGADLWVGTEAALHRVPSADVVAFLDLDQELLAPRYRAAEQAMALIVRAARVAGPRPEGRILLQTRQPDHDVVRAAALADPGRLARAELERRRALQQPPAWAWAMVSGPSAEDYIERFGSPLGVDVQGPADGTWRLRSADREALLDALAVTERPPGRLRVEVDPLRA